MDSIKREKPSDIKTVPLVPEALGQEIHSSPYVESATAKLRRKSMLVGLVKVIVAIIFISAMVLMALATLAVTGKISEKLSPLHTIGYLWQKNKQEKTEQPANTAQDLTPEIIDENQSAEQAPQSEAKEEKNVLDIVKDYVFSDGTTLEDRIEHSHQNLSGNIEWSFVPTEEQNIYSIAVKIPQNKDGQGFSYLFNYNSNENVLTPTTSESKNIMENYSK